jgi:hypothetical protein
MLWSFVKTAGELYVLAFAAAMLFALALSRINGPISRQEEFEAYQR